jgi:hypothetical protein
MVHLCRRLIWTCRVSVARNAQGLVSSLPPLNLSEFESESDSDSDDAEQQRQLEEWLNLAYVSPPGLSILTPFRSGLI